MEREDGDLMRFRKNFTSKASIFLRAGLFNSEMRLRMEEEVFSGNTCEDEGFQALSCGGGSRGFVGREGESEEMMRGFSKDFHLSRLYVHLHSQLI